MPGILSKSFSKERSYKPAVYLILKFVIAAVLITYLIVSVEYQKVFLSIKNADLYLITFCLLLSILNIYLQYTKWRIICGRLLNESNSKKIFISLFYGFSAGIATPFRVGEYLGRAIPFKDKSLVSVTLASFIDKIFPLSVVAFFGSISAILFFHYYYKATLYLTISLFLILFAAFYFLFFLLNNHVLWSGFLEQKLRKYKFTRKIQDKLNILTNIDLESTTKIGVISFLFYLTYIFQFALLLGALSGGNDFVYFIWIASLVMFSKSIIPPVTVGELGIREGASVFFAGVFGLSAAAGFSASILLFFINLVLPSLFGLLLLLKRE